MRNLLARILHAAPAAPRHQARPVLLAKSKQSLAIELINPLINLSVREAQAIFDQARAGCYARLHYIFSEMERSDPTLMVMADRRAAALSELDWSITRTDTRRHRAADETLAQEQIAVLEEAIADCSNLPEALEHLGQGFFRGFGAVSPVLSADALTVKSFELPDTWNFCWDRARQVWQWNPNATICTPGVNSGLSDVPDAELVVITRRLFIDYPAMSIYLRAALGERDWGRFLERYGVPPCTVIMPEFADKTEEDKYVQAAQDMANAGNGALPHGSEVSYATEARGTDPFTAFLEHQQKLVVLMATGGLATSLETAQGLGSGTSNAHSDSWRSIIRRDARIVSNAIQRQVAERILAVAFPGRPVLAEFKLDAEPTPTSAEVFTDATAARAAGYTIAQEDIEQLTGYTLSPFTPTPSNPAWAMNAPTPDYWHARRPVANLLQNARNAANAATGGSGDETRQNANLEGLQVFADALAADLSPVADRVAALLALSDVSELRAQAMALLDELPDLLPADPEMAALIEEEIARAFAATAAEDHDHA